MVKKTEKGFLAGKFGKKTSTTACWDELPGDLIARLVVAVSKAGGAVLFGHTRDGGALALTFFHGNEKATEYHSITETVSDWLEDMVDWWEAAT